MGKSQELYRKTKRLIPGGTQLLSKRPEMFLPDLWPAYYGKAKGCLIWDLDKKKYIDMSYMGIGACILGYADDDVNKAVESAVRKGNMTTLNAPEEAQLAELLCDLHPWAGMARFARTGGEALSMAVRIGRARTAKDKVLFCGYHGWHDWYLAANLADNKALDGHLLPGLEPKGVPRSLTGTSLAFSYNDTEGFLRLIEANKKEVGVVVLESVRNAMPKKDFLKTIRKVTKDLNIVLVLDEVSAGWRLVLGGAHLVFGLEPDMAVFAKGMSNGYPMAAVIGRKETMEASQDSFISSTYWTDSIGPAAALATIKKLKEKNVAKHLEVIGKKVQEGWKRLAEDNNLEIHVSGIYPLGHFEFVHEKPLVLKTLFTQFMMEKGFLATTSFYPSYSHNIEHVNNYLKAVDGAFKFIRNTLKKPEKYLKGPVCHAGFRRLA